MNLTVNGKQICVEEGLPVSRFVAQRKLNPKTVIIELNRTIVPGDQWEKTILQPDDKLEIVTFVGGG